MINEHIAQLEAQQYERELAGRLERRRIAAERAVREHGGERLAVIAHLARQARRSPRAVGRTAVAGC